jgi:hypothetical protein
MIAPERRAIAPEQRAIVPERPKNALSAQPENVEPNKTTHE